MRIQEGKADPHRSRRLPGFPLSQEALDKLGEARLDYKIRSKLSHGEHVDILPEDLYQLDDLTKSFLIAMIDFRDRVQSRQDLLKYLEAQRLA